MKKLALVLVVSLVLIFAVSYVTLADFTAKAGYELLVCCIICIYYDYCSSVYCLYDAPESICTTMVNYSGNRLLLPGSRLGAIH